jgi:hypothetical protein
VRREVFAELSDPRSREYAKYFALMIVEVLPISFVRQQYFHIPVGLVDKIA